LGSSTLEISADTKPDLLNLKKFPTKAYSFGLGRGEVFKTHVNEVYYKAEEGLANPGPGTYTPPPIIGKDTP